MFVPSAITVALSWVICPTFSSSVIPFRTFSTLDSMSLSTGMADLTEEVPEQEAAITAAASKINLFIFIVKGIFQQIVSVLKLQTNKFI
jgi:hypothetical protein